MKYLMTPTLGTIFEAIIEERMHQDKKYGPVLESDGAWKGEPRFRQGPGGHELPGWLLVIRKELREAEDAATGSGPTARAGTRHSTRAELVQIAAVCVAALEQHGLEE